MRRKKIHQCSKVFHRMVFYCFDFCAGLVHFFTFFIKKKPTSSAGCETLGDTSLARLATDLIRCLRFK